eukprot:897794-Pyramimonas_sp.AAC.1
MPLATDLIIFQDPPGRTCTVTPSYKLDAVQRWTNAGITDVTSCITSPPPLQCRSLCTPRNSSTPWRALSTFVSF